MSRPRARFSAELIADLKKRVADHAAWVALGDGRPTTRLQALKDQYERHYRGANPHQRALAKVDEHLAGLRKVAEDNFEEHEHPRDENGRFTDKGAGASTPPPSPPMPRTRNEHKKLQEENAGYEAATSTALVSDRYRAAGESIRTLGTYGAGVAAAASLARTRAPGKTGFVRRGTGKLGEQIGRVSAALLVGVPVHGARTVANKGVTLAGKVAGRNWNGISPEAARRVVSGAVSGGGKAGRFIGDKGIAAVESAMRNLARAAEESAKHPPTGKVGRALAAAGLTSGKVRRLAAIAVPGLLIGAKINQSVKGSWLDPEVHGRSIDPFTYRVVRKGEGLDEKTQALLKVALAGGSYEEMQKAVRLRALGAVGQSIAGAAGAIGGALLGGGAAYGASRAVGAIGSGKKGNPYRDEDGKFTSKDRAVHTVGAGAAAGALIGGAAAVMAARRGNMAGLARAISDRIGSKFQIRTSQVMSGKGYGKSAQLLSRKEKIVEDLVAGNKVPDIKGAGGVRAIKDLHEAKRAADLYGASSPHAFKEALRADANRHLATELAQMDDFVVANGKTLREVRAAEYSPQRRGNVAAAAAARAVEGYDLKQFKAAIAKLPKDKQDDLLRLRTARDDLIGQVDKQLGEHLKLIDTRRAAAKAAEDATQKTADALEPLKTRMAEAGANPPAELKAEFDAAEAAFKKARTAETRAIKAFEDLKTKGPDITGISGKPIAAPSTGDMARTNLDMERRARDAAESLFDTNLERVRGEQLAELRHYKARMTAAAAAGVGRGSVPRAARVARKELLLAQGKLRVARNAANEATLAGAPKEQIAALRNKVIAAANERAQAAEAFETAITGSKASRTILPPGVRKQLDVAMRDYGQIRGAVSRRVAEFAAKPTTKNLLDTLGTMARRGKTEFKSTLRSLFTEQQGDKTVLSPERIMRAWPLLAGAGGAAMAYGDWLYGKMTKPPGQRAREKMPNNMKLERHTDPVTGGGFVGVSMTDPDNKNERVFLWGRRWARDGAPREQIFAGGRVSDFRNRQNQNSQGGGGGQQQGGDARNLPKDLAKKIQDGWDDKQIEAAKPDFDGAPEVKFRKGADADSARNGAAGEFMNHIRKEIGGQTPEKGGFWNTLGDLFSRQGAILKPGQMTNLITGWSGDGMFRQGMFAKNEGLKGGDADAATEALSDEISRIMRENAPRDDRQRANLHRAVHIVGMTKKIPADSLASIHASIKGTSGAGTEAPRARKSSTSQFDLPEGWKSDEVKEVAQGHAPRVAKALAMHEKDDTTGLGIAIGMLARKVHADHRLGMRHSISVVADTLVGAAMDSSALSRGAARDSIRAGEYDVFYNEMDRIAQDLVEKLRREAKKVTPTGALRKSVLGYARRAFDETRITRQPSGSDRGGEFASKGGGAASASTPSPPKAGGSKMGGPQSELPVGGQKPVKERAFTDPHRMSGAFAAEVGSAGGGIAAFKLADRYLNARAGRRAAVSALAGAAPARTGAVMRLATRFLPAMGGVAGTAVRLGASIAGAAAGGAVANEAAQRAVDAGYRAAGRKSPGRYEPPAATDFGQIAAEFVGSTVGVIAGGAAGAVGGPVGSFAGATAGSVAGAEVGKQIHRWFTGYDKKASSRIGRYFEGLR
jgi:hypothetical protein